MNLEHGSWFEHVLLFLGAWLLVAIIVAASIPLWDWIYNLLHPDNEED